MENARIYTGADIRAYEKDLEIAADLGCTKILTNIWSKEMAEAQEQFDELCELALTYGQSVHLEFVTWSTVRDLQDAAAVLRKSGKDNVGIIIDTLHFYRSRVHPEEIDSIPADWFNYVHLCDCVARIPEDPEELAATGVSERMIPGMGAVNIREIVEKLPPVIYGLEVPSDKMLKEMGAKGYLQELLIRTKKYLQAR